MFRLVQPPSHGSRHHSSNLGVEIEEMFKVPGDHLFEELVVAESLVQEVVESIFQVEQRLNVRDGIFRLQIFDRDEEGVFSRFHGIINI